MSLTAAAGRHGHRKWDIMTETQQEQATEDGAVEEQVIQSKLDDDGSNPFWPKGAGSPGQPDNPDSVKFVDVTFSPTDPADVAINVATTPPGADWSANWGDGTATENFVGPLAAATHHYADKSTGKAYVITITSAADSDTRNIQY